MTAQLSTLCYIERDGKYLMLHRTVKKNDVNKDKWIGVGGHFEADESPEECLLREVREETGYRLTSYRYRGIVTFVSGNGVTEYMSLFTADGFEGEAIPCDEGELEWVDIEDVWKLNLWEGDKIFFRLLDERKDFFSLKLVYDGQDRLVSAALDGEPLELFDILNPDGSRTGIVRERGVVHREGSLHATVHTWIVRENGKDGWMCFCRNEARGRIPIRAVMTFLRQGMWRPAMILCRQQCGNLPRNWGSRLHRRNCVTSGFITALLRRFFMEGCFGTMN